MPFRPVQVGAPGEATRCDRNPLPRASALHSPQTAYSNPPGSLSPRGTFGSKILAPSSRSPAEIRKATAAVGSPGFPGSRPQETSCLPPTPGTSPEAWLPPPRSLPKPRGARVPQDRALQSRAGRPSSWRTPGAHRSTSPRGARVPAPSQPGVPQQRSPAAPSPDARAASSHSFRRAAVIGAVTSAPCRRPRLGASPERWRLQPRVARAARRGPRSRGRGSEPPASRSSSGARATGMRPWCESESRGGALAPPVARRSASRDPEPETWHRKSFCPSPAAPARPSAGWRRRRAPETAGRDLGRPALALAQLARAPPSPPLPAPGPGRPGGTLCLGEPRLPKPGLPLRGARNSSGHRKHGASGDRRVTSTASAPSPAVASSSGPRV